MSKDILPDFTKLPTRVDRRTGAELLTRYMFPVSHRTLEAWPLQTVRVNGRALYDTRGLFEFARQKLANAPVMMGGRKPVDTFLA